MVREALIRLQADGLDLCPPGRRDLRSRRAALGDHLAGPAIQHLGLPEIVRGALCARGGAAQLAAERRTTSNLNNLTAINEQLRSRMMRGESASDEDFMFHREVAVASGNDLFVSQLENLRSVRRRLDEHGAGVDQPGLG